jgi:hypothetical protein
MWLLQRVPFSYVNVYSLPNCFNTLGSPSLLYAVFYGLAYNSNTVMNNNGHIYLILYTFLFQNNTNDSNKQSKI